MKKRKRSAAGNQTERLVSKKQEFVHDVNIGARWGATMNARALAEALGLAKAQNGGFLSRCPLANEHNHNDADPSLSIKHASNGTILVHCQSRHANEQDRVVAELKRRGYSLTNANQSTSGDKPQDINYQLVQPVPDNELDNANRLGKFLANQLGASNDGWRFPYRDATGNVLYCVFRLQLPNGKKEIRPATLWRNRNNRKLQWRSKWPPTLSLYLLETLTAHPELPVLIVEGELKAEMAAQVLARNYLVVSLCGGAKAIEKNDLTPLRNRAVVAWPDNDRDGFEAMARIARLLEARQQPIINNVRLILPDKEWPTGYDIGDLIEKERWDTPQLFERLSAARTHLVDEIEVEIRRRFTKKGKGTAKSTGGTQTDELIAIARAETLFDDENRAYASVKANGHLETHRIRSRSFRHWLTKRYLDEVGKAPNSEALGAALKTIEAVALYTGESRKVFLRVAGFGGRLFLDLCNATWQVIEVDTNGWRVIESADAPVRFRRGQGMLALPIPEAGGSINDLRQYVNAASDEDFQLYVAWLLNCFRDRGPYPILALHGEAGAAKSSTATVLRRLVDPHVVGLRGEQKDLRDLMIGANSNWIMGFDNLSHLPAWLADAFCRLATGGGFGTRALYENDEELLIEAKRPILVTGIEELMTRGDAADRALVHSLPRIKVFKTEEDFDADFYRAQPRLLGAFLSAVAGTLQQIDSVQLEKPPRMADFAKWGVAVEKALGWDPGSFLVAYAENRESANETSVEASAIGPALRQLALPFAGTATDLLSELNKLVDEKKQRERFWPKSPRALSGALRRLAPSLRATGIDLDFDRDPATHKRSRNITIRNAAPPASDNSHRDCGHEHITPTSVGGFTCDDCGAFVFRDNKSTGSPTLDNTDDLPFNNSGDEFDDDDDLDEYGIPKMEISSSRIRRK